jgi:hypothetical protein
MNEGPVFSRAFSFAGIVSVGTLGPRCSVLAVGDEIEQIKELWEADGG